MLNEGHNTVARTKVQQIMNIWQHRQKVSKHYCSLKFGSHLMYAF